MGCALKTENFEENKQLNGFYKSHQLHQLGWGDGGCGDIARATYFYARN